MGKRWSAERETTGCWKVLTFHKQTLLTVLTEVAATCLSSLPMLPNKEPILGHPTVPLPA
jgi:hypothetical protein